MYWPISGGTPGEAAVYENSKDGWKSFRDWYVMSPFHLPPNLIIPSAPNLAYMIESSKVDKLMLLILLLLITLL